LHWLERSALRAMYAGLAAGLRPGGVVLNGDHLTEDEAQAPVLARLGRALTERWGERAGACDDGGDGESWGQGAAAGPGPGGAPVREGPAAERARRRLSEDHHGSESVRLAEHVRALRAAGFTEIGTIWQHGENRILAAVSAP